MIRWFLKHRHSLMHWYYVGGSFSVFHVAGAIFLVLVAITRKFSSISTPPEAIGGRLPGGLRRFFCSVGFVICLPFQIKSLASRYRNIKFLSSRYRNYKFPAPMYWRISTLWAVEPAWGIPRSILTCASYMGLWIRDVCGLVHGHSALAAVSFYPIVGSR